MLHLNGGAHRLHVVARVRRLVWVEHRPAVMVLGVRIRASATTLGHSHLERHAGRALRQRLRHFRLLVRDRLAVHAALLVRKVEPDRRRVRLGQRERNLAADPHRLADADHQIAQLGHEHVAERLLGLQSGATDHFVEQVINRAAERRARGEPDVVGVVLFYEAKGLAALPPHQVTLVDDEAMDRLAIDLAGRARVLGHQHDVSVVQAQAGP
eukprot:250667-Prymnesium_polylepis.3